MTLRIAAKALLALALFHATSTAAFDRSPERSGDFPPYAGAYEAQSVDERGLWAEVDELERKLKFSREIVEDERLNAYLRRVLCNAVGSERCETTRIHVLRDVDFNAGMYPNGLMVLNSGLLLRLRNEAELASVLGHEFAHFEKRHALKGFANARGGSDVAMWATILTGVDLSAIFLTNLFSYSREMEREADGISATYLAASPYPSKASADIWLRLLEEDATRAEERKRRKRGRHARWFDSHPSPLERADYLTRTTAAMADDGDYGTDRFADAVDSHLLTFFDDQLQRNDFAASKFILDQIAGENWRPLHYLMQGELYRKRGAPRDLVTAEQAYRKAIALGLERPESWRGLGLVLLRSGDREGGREALQAYLERAPEAGDAPMISMMIGG